MALLFSVMIAVPSGLMLDFGETARLTGIGLLIFCGWVLVGMWRRPQNLTSIDLLLIRWGCLPLVIAIQVLIRVVWLWRGHL